MERTALNSHPVRAWRLAAAGALLAVLVAALTRGRLHPDEVFQFLEPAHGLAFGYRVSTWEWEVGLRNLAVPGVLAAVLEVGAGLGLEHPWALVGLIWLACAAVQAMGTVALIRLLEERDGRGAALFGAGVFVTWGGWLLYAARPLGDALSVAPLLGALLWAWHARTRGTVWAGLWCGLLLGAAFVIRYPSAVFGVPIAVSLLASRRWRSLAGFAVGSGVVLLGLGVLDWMTWGEPWASAWRYLQFNITSGSSAEQFGRKPVWWYLPILAGMVPVLLSWHFVRGLARRDLLLGAFVLYFGVVSALGHKEARFLVPLIPLFVAIAAAPAWRDISRLRARSRAALGGVVGLFVLASALAATVQRPVGLRTEVIDAVVSAGREPGLTGLVIAGPAEWNTGGRFYLHREVPVFVSHGKSPEELHTRLTEPLFSHVLVEGTAVEPLALERAGFCPVRRWGKVALWRRCPQA
jgi:phosphatidylinositol glycan class B